MDTATLLPALSMMTLGFALLVIVVGFAIYWRKRSNRAPRDGGTPTDDGSV
jgi:hypothetical protein